MAPKDAKRRRVKALAARGQRRHKRSPRPWYCCRRAAVPELDVRLHLAPTSPPRTSRYRTPSRSQLQLSAHTVLGQSFQSPFTCSRRGQRIPATQSLSSKPASTAPSRASGASSSSPSRIADAGQLALRFDPRYPRGLFDELCTFAE